MMSKNFLRLVSVFILISFLLFPLNSYPLPQGEEVVAGSAAFDRSQADTLNINQATDKMIANYQSFSIARPEAVHFHQPSSSSIALNRVVGADPSNILGTLTANGRIFLVNPNGILFGQGCRVDTAGMIASTLNITDTDFLAGRYTFYGQGGSVVNQGYISAPGGYISLLGQTVENTGVIEAELGSIALASGEAITLNLDPQGLISVVIDEATTQNLEDKADAIKNTGTLSADGGKVVLTAKALEGVFDRAINTEGIIEANALNNVNGEIVLDANQRINVAGEISAEGGTVQVKAKGADIHASILSNNINFDLFGGFSTFSGDYWGNITLSDPGDVYVDGDLTIGEFEGNCSLIITAKDGTNVVPVDETGSFYHTAGLISTTSPATGDITISGYDLTLGDISAAGEFTSTAENSILDDGDSNTMITAEDITLVAGENIGGFEYDQPGATPNFSTLLPYFNSMLDVSLGDDALPDTLTAEAGGNIYLAEHGNLNAKASQYYFHWGDEYELGVVNLTGDENSFTMDIVMDDPERNIWLVADNIEVISQIVNSTAPFLGFYANNNITLNADISSGDEMELYADFDENNSGAISQSAGNTITISDSGLILYAAEGIGAEANPLNTQVSNLQATNTASGDIYIVNSGTLTLANLDDRSISVLTGDPEDDNDFYSVLNGSSLGSTISISATGDILTRSYWNGTDWQNICAVGTFNSNIILSAGHDIILGDDYNDGDIYTGAGDITLTALNDIVMRNYTYVEGMETITFNAGNNVTVGHVGFYLKDSNQQNPGAVSIIAEGSILDDSTDTENTVTLGPTFIKASTINLTATNGSIGSFNDDAWPLLDEMFAPMLDVFLGNNGTLTANAPNGNIYINDYKPNPNGVEYTSTKYQLNCKDSSVDTYNEIIFANLAGDITINEPLTLYDNQHFGAMGDIEINSSVITTADVGALGFHAVGDLDVNADITLNGSSCYDPWDEEIELPWMDLEADMDGDGDGTVTIGAGKTVTTSQGGDIWIYAKDITTGSNAVIDAKGNDTSGKTEIEIVPSVASEDIYLGVSSPPDGFVLDLATFDTFKADEVSIGEAWDDEDAHTGDIYIGILDLVTNSQIITLGLGTRGRILNNNSSSRLIVSNLEMEARGLDYSDPENPTPYGSAIGEDPQEPGTTGPLNIDVDTLVSVQAGRPVDENNWEHNSVYLNETDDIKVGEINADTFYLNAGGSILDDEKQQKWQYNEVTEEYEYVDDDEDPTKIENWFCGISRIGAVNITLIAQGNIGNDADNDNNLDAGYLDISRWDDGDLKVTTITNGNVFLNFVNSYNALDNRVVISTPPNAIVVLADSGHAYEEDGQWKINEAVNAGLNYGRWEEEGAGMVFNPEADLIFASRANLRVYSHITSESYLGLYSTEDVEIRPNMNVISDEEIEIVADFYSEYLEPEADGSGGDGNGAILQFEEVGTIEAENLILSAATGIGSDNPLETQAAYLQATNTISGNINIINTGTLILTNLDGVAIDDDYYSVLNEAQGGSVSITASGSNADILGQHVEIDGAAYGIDAVEARGNITLDAGRDIILGYGSGGPQVDEWSDISMVTEVGDYDITLQAVGDIKMLNDSNTWNWIYSCGDGEITLDAGGDVLVGTIGFHIDDLDKNSGIVTIKAGGSILDDSTDSEWMEDIIDGPGVYEIPTLIKANNINLTADNNGDGNGSIGNFNHDYWPDLDKMFAPMLDVNLGSGKLTAEAGGDVYIAEHGNLNLLASQYSFPSVGALGIEYELGIANLTEGESENSIIFNIPINPHHGMWAVADNIIINEDCPVASSGGEFLGFAAFNNIMINADISSNGQEIQLEADLDNNGSGSVVQGGNAVISNADRLIVWASEGIGTDINPLTTSVSKLQATNTGDGALKIINYGDLDLVDLEGLGYAISNAGTDEADVVNISAITELTGLPEEQAIEMWIRDPIMTSGGNLSLLCSDDILQEADVAITTSGGNVYIEANYEDKGVPAFGIFDQYDDGVSSASINADDGDIEIKTGDGMMITNLTTTGDVYLTEATDEIYDGGDVLTDIIANRLIISSVDGIGMEGIPDPGDDPLPVDNPALETQVSYLEAVNTTEGDINIVNNGNLTAGSVVNTAPGGEVNIAVHSDLIVDSLSAEGDVSLTADEDIDASGTIDASGHTVTLDAGGDIIDTSDDTSYLWASHLVITDAQNVGGSGQNEELDTRLVDIQINASGDVYAKEKVIGGANALSLKDITANSINIEVPGNISVFSGSNINVANTATVESASGTISGTGSLTCNELILAANSGISLTNLAITNLSASNSSSNNIILENTGNLNAASIVNNAPAGQITLNNNSELTVGTVTADGNITLSASETNDPPMGVDDLTINADIISSDGNIILQAGDDIFQNDGTTIQTEGEGNTIILTAANNDEDGIGGIIQEGSAQIVTNNGNITLSAWNDVRLTLLKAALEDTPSIDAGVVEVDSVNGEIFDNDGGSAPNDYDIIASAVDLNPSDCIYRDPPDEIDLLLSSVPLTNFILSHIIEQWSNDNTINISWEAAIDGIDGYYYMWDTSSDTIPGEGFPFIPETNLSSAELDDSNNHWFHICALYEAGGVSDSIDFGPFFIDTTPPLITAGVPQGTEGLNDWWTTDVTVPFSATDNLSGFDITTPTLQTTLASKTTTGEGDNLTVASDTITDIAGNQAEVAQVGPFKVDNTDPTIDIALTSGTEGLNNWYITAISATLDADDDTPAMTLSSVEYSLDDGATGRDYNNQSFNIDEDGIYPIGYRVENEAGRIAKAYWKLSWIPPRR